MAYSSHARTAGLFTVMLLVSVGCTRSRTVNSEDVLFVVPGVGGNGPEYRSLVRGLEQGGYQGNIRIVKWGAPPPLRVLNFQNEAIHTAAERKLVLEIATWRVKHPSGRIDLIGHSAGGGVVLGAMSRLDRPMRVAHAILLAPSVSPQYDLSWALSQVDRAIHVYYSHRDTFWLEWRTGTFGTYDNVRTPAAGNLGFTGALPSNLRVRLVQHPYKEIWNSLHNNGGHFGSLAENFAREELAPLLAEVQGGKLTEDWSRSRRQ